MRARTFFKRQPMMVGGLFACIALFTCSPWAGQPLLAADTEVKASDTMLIEPQQLKEKPAAQPRLRILDARSAEAYAAGHIPGAVWVDVDQWKKHSLAEGGLHDASLWADKVGRLGIQRQTPVLVYGDQLTDTARIWWLLKYFGVQQVALLDGGWQAWLDHQGATDTKAPQVAARRFQPQFQADRLEEIDTLKQSLDARDITVVDARSDDEFTGRDVRGPRGGHIPGSAHLEWKELLTEDGRFKPRDELRKLFQQRGIHPEQTAITC